MMQQDQLYKQVELKVSCRCLKDQDTFSKSDPLVVIKIKDQRTGQWSKVGESEVIKNNLNPNFKHTFQINYFFEERQDLHFEVLDYDDNGHHDHLGECFVSLGSIVGARNNTYVSDLTNKKTNKKIEKSKIIIAADSFKECNDVAQMEWGGVKLANTDGFFDKSDPFLRLLRLREDGQSYTLAHETERVMDNLNPIWKTQQVSVSKLCNGEALRTIKGECWDWQKNEKHQFIGEFTFTIDELMKGKREFPLTNPKRKAPGTIQLRSFQYIRKPSFLEYLRGNTQLNLMLAVDFTASNGAISTPESLHYMNPSVMNAYQQAIYSIGGILLDYDFDKKIPCFGFGGVPRYPNMTFPNVQHCFPMSGNPQAIEAVGGIPEIMNLYSYSLQNVSLSGPTLFHPIIQEGLRISQYCKQNGSQIYTVLLILTDGEIHDMQASIDSIVYAAQYPLSIIIIGIGSADFTNMQKLDGDSGLINSQGQKTARDLVQFVEFNKVKGSVSSLSQQVLAEVPNQLVNYMIQQNIMPSQPPPINMANH